MKTGGIEHDDIGTVYVGLAALLAVCIYLGWEVGHAEIAYSCLKWAWYQLAIVDLGIAPPAMVRWRAEISALAANPDAVGLKALLRCLNNAGLPFVAVPVLITLRGVWRATRHPANHTRRSISAETLPRIMATHSPAIIPSLYYENLLNSNPEEHRSSLNPEEWVAQHGLLVNGTLDRTRSLTLLTTDLGKPVNTLAEMAPPEKALFAIFGARLLGREHERGEAQRLLDQLNRSCHTGTWQGKRGYPDLSLTESAFARYASAPGASEWLARHPYPRTLLHAMHKEALAFGRLPSSYFRWLKGMDRGLWYALNTTGRKAPFIESAAVFTQTLWESYAYEHGYRLTSPCLDGAVDGIETYLAKIGLLATRATRSPP